MMKKRNWNQASANRYFKEADAETKKNRTEQSITEQSRTEQNRTEKREKKKSCASDCNTKV